MSGGVNKGINPKELTEQRKIEMVGKRFSNHWGETAVVLEYTTAVKIRMKLIDRDYEFNGYLPQLLKGEWQTPYTPKVYNKGFIGEGKYKPTIGIRENGHTICSKEYDMWSGLFVRIYSEEYLKTKPTYIGCSVSDDWLNFQNFGEWFESNYWECGDETMCLDKDILVKNNKIYSPNTCLIVPKNINTLFTNCKRVRGELPVGISKRGNKYIARVSMFLTKGKGYRWQSSVQPTIEKAFMEYKRMKEQYIKEVADSYKAKYPNFPQKLYDALYNYEVEITD